MRASEAAIIEAGARELRVSSPDRVIFPATEHTPDISKLDVVHYYLAVGDGIMRALAQRPTTLERWPKGVHPGIVVSTREKGGGDAFFQKRIPRGAPDYVETARIQFPSGRHADEICPTEVAVVGWAAQMGTITFHPWPVREDDVDHPDELRLDLDPQPGTDFADAVRVAAEARVLLDELGYTGFPKTSGGRGVHIYVRIEPIWRTDVGRIPLYLLDADRPENSETARWITSRLYIGDENTRLAQYLLLGIGGVRALEAMGIEPSIVHLNEGHAAFVSLELARREYSGNGSLSPALEIARKRTVSTTHTPLPAGNDTYPAAQVAGVLSHIAGRLGIDPDEIISLGRTNPTEEAEPFGVTQFALRTSRAANGVSRRHGEVAREMWHAMWPEKTVDDVPITYVTNGVHVPTWLGRPMWELLNRHLGEDWLDRATDPATWAPVDDIPANELWDVRSQQRAELISYVRHR